MTQKQMLLRALDFAELPFEGDSSKTTAARAYCVIAWLHDMNWHAETRLLEARAKPAVTSLTFRRLIEEAERTSELDNIASLTSCLCGGLAEGGWRGLEAPERVEELWNIINGTPSPSRIASGTPQT